MKEEIKDILELLRDGVKRPVVTLSKYSLDNICELNPNECKKLLEYIENLQSQLKAKEEENEQLKADYGNLAHVERDFLKEIIKEIIEYLQSKEFKENFPYEANECQVRGYILNIVDKERTNENNKKIYERIQSITY